MMVATVAPRSCLPWTGIPSSRMRPALCLTPGGRTSRAAAQVSDFPQPLLPSSASTRPRRSVSGQIVDQRTLGVEGELLEFDLLWHQWLCSAIR
ncbi:Uncharacterised protein [Raoultella terrigena]|uniref:Uncharacterized protein n=1 Tax=Raoultella terrigena TaxID=577 RepID=A0A4U9D3S4_RAOTE|nr:Uncharacterised protein [Raoultella terrigena]